MTTPPEHEDEADDGWLESSEGDLDPDLTDEAGYAGWEPSRSNEMFPTIAKVVGAVLLAALLLSVILPALT